MINFSPLRTKRLSVALHEISISSAISLALVPPERNEASTTEFLQNVIASAELSTPQHVSDPRLWTVQERMLAVCHYLAHVSDEGANFSVGDRGNFQDYLNTNKDIGTYPIEIGAVGGDEWMLSPLLGASAEAIESLHGDIPKLSGQFHWVTGAMAAQLSLKGEITPAIGDHAGYLEWLKNRMTIFAAYPESQYVELLGNFMEGSNRLSHLFNIEFSKDGIVAMPNFKEGSEEEVLPPTRFPVSSCISEIAKRFSGKP